MKITMQTVKSSNIAAMGYDEESKTAHIDFTNGTTYAYENVAREDFEAVRDAQRPRSVGSEFQRIFRKKYLGKKITVFRSVADEVKRELRKDEVANAEKTKSKRMIASLETVKQYLFEPTPDGAMAVFRIEPSSKHSGHSVFTYLCDLTPAQAELITAFDDGRPSDPG